MRNKIGIVLIVLILAVVVYFLVHAILSSIPYPLGNPAGLIPFLPVLGMLRDPFRTTRKMKVPFHSRKGHAERNSETLFRAIMWFVALVLLLSKIYTNYEHQNP